MSLSFSVQPGSEIVNITKTAKLRKINQNHKYHCVNVVFVKMLSKVSQAFLNSMPLHKNDFIMTAFIVKVVNKGFFVSALIF